jgi:methionyl-tRNA formyltransferase
MNTNNIPFVFFGTPTYAVETLEALHVHGYTPTLIVTAPDRPQGRGLITQASPVALWAETHNIPTLKPEKITVEITEQIAQASTGVFIVAAYGKILPQKLLDIPTHGTLNVHPSLLPTYRGPSPLEAPILAGDTETGVTIIALDREVDHGPILAQEVIPLTGVEFAHELGTALFKKGGEILARILPEYIAGKITLTEQDHTRATFTKKITKEHGLVDTEKEPGTELWAKFRAYTPWPGLYFFKEHTDGTQIRIKIKTAHHEGEQFVVDTVIPEGKKEISYKDYLKK